MDKIEKLNEIIDKANYIVFFGGAGVSTESGIKDFRSIDGLYNMKYDYPPEEILSSSFFWYKTKEFYKFYKDKMLCLDVLPNKCHYKLKELEDRKKLKAIITQNIDGLHQKAGSKNVYELHGTIHNNYCLNCKKKYNAEYIQKSIDLPRCEKCGAIIKPKVVLYEERLDDNILKEAIFHIKQADVLIIGGTSLKVYPAAGLIDYFQGKHLIVINKTPTISDSKADLVINEAIGEVFSKIK